MPDADPIVQPRRARLQPIRYVARREPKRTSDGRLWWRETWSDGTVTKRFMGPREHAAFQRRRGGQDA